MTPSVWSLRLALAALMLVAAAISPAAAQDNSLAPPNLPVRTKWESLPNGDDVVRAYPARARRNGVGGAVVVTCGVDADGYLRGCEILAERPEGYGFGEAALSLMPRFKMKPLSPDGKTVEGGKVTIPIGFNPY